MGGAFLMEAKKITPEAAKAEVNRAKNPNFTEHENVLKELLSKVVEVDFRKLAYKSKYTNTAKKFERLQREHAALLADKNKNKSKIEQNKSEREQEKKKLDKMKLRPRHFIVYTVEHLISLAKRHNWGLTKYQQSIYLFNGAYWAEIPEDVFTVFLGEAAERMGVTEVDAKYCDFRAKLFDQFNKTAVLAKPKTDPSKVLINLKNGTLEVQPNGETKLRPFDRRDFLTYQMPFEFDPEATAPKFEKFLFEVLPEDDKRRVLAEYLGSVFLRNGNDYLKIEKALFLYGTGRNGKSVVYEVVNALLGNENTSSFTLEDLTNDNGYYRAQIANKLVNYASEINGKLQADKLKTLTSGEPIGARLPYKDPVTIKDYAKLVFNVNELPRNVEQTHAFFSRFLIIPFEITIPDSKADRNLHKKIIDAELPGVLNWILEGLNRLLKNKDFTPCESSARVLEQFKIESDSVKFFLQEHNAKPHVNEWLKLSQLYAEYRDFTTTEGAQPVKRMNFKKRLQEAGYAVEKKNVGNVIFVNGNFETH